MMEVVNNFGVLIGIIINLGGAIVIVAGFYYKTRAEFEAIKLEIEEIKKDRTEKWAKYNSEQHEQDDCYKNLLDEIRNMGGDIKQIKTNIEWLKKK